MQMLFPAWLFISMMDNIWYLFVLKLSKFWKFLDCLENFQESCLTTKKVSNLLGKVWDWLESFQTDWNQVLDIFNTEFPKWAMIIAWKSMMLEEDVRVCQLWWQIISLSARNPLNYCSSATIVLIMSTKDILGGNVKMSISKSFYQKLHTLP